MMPFSDYLKANRPCQHEHWAGIPEVDAYCTACGADEMEADKEQTQLLESWQVLQEIERDAEKALQKGIEAMNAVQIREGV
jgi:hypothetical protein